MIKRKLFYKNKKNFLIFYIFIILILFFIIFYYINSHNKYFSIKPNNELFYFVPDNKGGLKIENQDKKSLHLSYIDENNIIINNNLNLKYSIQLFANSDYFVTIDKKNQFLLMENNFFNKDDLFILLFKTSIGNDYLLVYKNFDFRADALSYCNKYLHFLDKCLIVNAENLN